MQVVKSSALLIFLIGISHSKAVVVKREDSDGFCSKANNECLSDSGILGDCGDTTCTKDNNPCTFVRICGGMGFCDSWNECT
ncbi:hypothetical protein GGS20DRAFT_581816 [Poronia punctata]|nr:hypothetical protein GGS20DRAFT_581816 [Poronia punctata]